MKCLIRTVSIVGLYSISLFAYADSITDTYATGDTLTAETLNNIKSAVNGNDASITDNTTNITDNTANISTNSANITDNTSDITTNISNITDNTANITTNDSRITALEARYMIGDTGPAGGWVFYVDADGRHGLEAAPTDQSTGIRWGDGSNSDTEAHGDGLGAGEMNTMLIIANQGSDSTTYAGGIAANLVITSAGVDYGDWYLPSKFELNLMYLNIGPGSSNVGGFASFVYWSSSEFNGVNAREQSFINGAQGPSSKGNALRVRAVRAF